MSAIFVFLFLILVLSVLTGPILIIGLASVLISLPFMGIEALFLPADMPNVARDSQRMAVQGRKRLQLRDKPPEMARRRVGRFRQAGA